MIHAIAAAELTLVFLCFKFFLSLVPRGKFTTRSAASANQMQFHSDRTQVNKKKETIAVLWFEYPSPRPPDGCFFFQPPGSGWCIGVLLKMRAEEKKSYQATGLFSSFFAHTP